MNTFSLSPDGQHVAIGLEEGGGEIMTVLVLTQKKLRAPIFIFSSKKNGCNHPRTLLSWMVAATSSTILAPTLHSVYATHHLTSIQDVRP